ncbi:putative beta-lysine N-acetyltransferase [Petroclostridium sp. X23]|uniref:putative beta-lysine N-acetyltransferase n=1 Tax=Petroclostridium sp. X23 TaxID=3045146 RepID=UPI0024AE026D|nr:putative beta-lysine N-acetyltransferase [Petroclostridium sp. X23]WHH56986.1 putative beta-lysine N-acetyltransferase [Petroclostridium sp. X23]
MAAEEVRPEGAAAVGIGRIFLLNLTTDNLYDIISCQLFFAYNFKYGKTYISSKGGNMMNDIIQKIGKSLVQHGKQNDRIYLMKLYQDDMPDIICELDAMAEKYNYSKIFAKVPSHFKQDYLDNSYVIEAEVPNFYNGRENALFLAKYLSEERMKSMHESTISEVLKIARQKQNTIEDERLDEKFQYRIAKPEDASQMANVYKKVFDSYPFPIYDPSYLKKTMEDNIVYFGIWHGSDVVALASSEMDINASNVEMTDFAILPEYRGNKLAVYLLNNMEQEMKKKGIKTAYTIARAISYGMNITFSRMGYVFAGTLINNTNISGSIESMNVWYKTLE